VKVTTEVDVIAEMDVVTEEYDAIGGSGDYPAG
jgi:hypothetical protein